MRDCVICQGAKTVRLPVYRKVSFAFDASAALSMDAPEEMYRTYECPECSGKQAGEEKVSIVYGETTIRDGYGDEKGVAEVVARELARMTADKLLRDGLIEIKQEKRGNGILFYSKLGAVSPRVVNRIERRAFDKMKEMLGNVLSRAKDSIAVWGSHYTGTEGMISKQQAMDYVEAAFMVQMNQVNDALKEKA